MQIPQIRLQQTYAQIGLRITQPVMEIEQQPADLSIKQTPAQMDITKTPSHLEIDQEEAWEQLGFKPLSVLTRDAAEDAKQAAVEAVGEIAQEGDQLAHIENKSNTVAAIVSSKANPAPSDSGNGFIPTSELVKINYTPSELHINWKLGETEINVTPHLVKINYTAGKTEVYLRQQPQLKTDFTEININV
ncbi:DUF6470 family protein [Pullulanibacillus sp. KACC 23026]|uniref:DUF6470 family protein n=1 Tax=Pullulanibacillus sp. KACC 23026 TaxID=3028315 RepID=UPI0023B1A7B8|nr:DUF6470 family protein [Pullulanibacillus sp. KACC 23026]WEG11250.1 DUF6470 family protein [Pullulanibacillus sp. KACC 23026]